jgi:hypothetical protein
LAGLKVAQRSRRNGFILLIPQAINVILETGLRL